MTKKRYTNKDIQVLSDRDHVRLRTSVYLGSTEPQQYSIPLFDNKLSPTTIEFVPATYKAINEIIDNSLDEFAQIKQSKKTLEIHFDESNNEITIKDNGRGIPITKHETGKYTPEVALGNLRSGRNFHDDKEAGVIGMNGVGSACTNFCSSHFEVKITRDGKRYSQKFKDGGAPTKPRITNVKSKNTGTEIKFIIDKSVLIPSVPINLLRNRVQEIALCNPDVNVKFNGELIKFNKGIKQYISDNNFDYFHFNNKADPIDVFIIHKADYNGEFYSWVNSSYLFEGGTCETHFASLFYNKVISHLKKDSQSGLKKTDVFQDIFFIINIKTSDPQYDNQAKTRLTGPSFKKQFSNIIDKQWSAFVRNNKEYFNTVQERIEERNNKQLTTQLTKSLKSTKHRNIPGFIDAPSKKRNECKLLITEGLSAARMITNVRDRNTGIYPLTGKINNVYGASLGSLAKAEKLKSLLSILNLIPGKRATRSGLYFGKIVVATDADYDGGDIFCLLMNLFHQFWPELFEMDSLYRLIAPNVVATKGSDRIYFPSIGEFNKQRKKYNNYEIEYFKGLGSMQTSDWKVLLSDERFTKPIEYDNNLSKTFELLFGPDANARKQWLLEE